VLEDREMELEPVHRAAAELGLDEDDQAHAQRDCQGDPDVPEVDQAVACRQQEPRGR
jgi:hypothetical protein